MTYEELLQSVTQALPETEGKIAIERVRYVKSENKAFFSFLSDVLIGEKGFFVMKNALGRAFPAKRHLLHAGPGNGGNRAAGHALGKAL